MRRDQASRRHWRRSGRCAANGTCVEIARDVSRGVAGVAIRDSAATDPVVGARLLLTAGQWQLFATQVRNGTYDR